MICLEKPLAFYVALPAVFCLVQTIGDWFPKYVAILSRMGGLNKKGGTRICMFSRAFEVWPIANQQRAKPIHNKIVFSKGPLTGNRFFCYRTNISIGCSHNSIQLRDLDGLSTVCSYRLLKLE